MTPARIPIAVLPLDRFGIQVARALQQAIEVAEPRLLNSGWLEILDGWTGWGEGNVAERLEHLLVLPRQQVDMHYTYATGGIPTVLLIVVGSLSQDLTVVLDRWRVLPDLFASLDQWPMTLPIIDISRFSSEQGDSTVDMVRCLSKSLVDISWQGNVFLVDNRNPYGPICSQREQIQEGVRLFLEATILGHHWEGLSDSWLNQPPPDEGFAYASFSVLSLRLPSVELHDQMIRASFCELLDPPRQVLPEDEPNLLPPITLDPQAVPPGHASSVPEFVPLPSRDLWRSKERVRERIAEVRDRWLVRFANWRSDMVRELYGARCQLIEGTNEALGKFDLSLRNRLRDTFEGAHFMPSLTTLAGELTEFAKHEEKDGKVAGSFDLPSESRARAVLKEPYHTLRPLINLMPNATSLVVYVILVFALQALLTVKLLRYWPGDPRWGQIVYWTGVGFVLLLLSYSAWRVPAWRLDYTLHGAIARAHGALMARLRDVHALLRSFLARHWNARNEKSARAKASALAANLRLCHKYLVHVATAERVHLPDSLELVPRLEGPCVFQKMLADPAELDGTISALYKTPAELWMALNGIKDELGGHIASGNARSAERLLRRAVRAVYPIEAFQTDTDVSDLIAETMLAQTPYLLNPLLRYAPSPDAGSDYHCLCNRRWRGQLESVLGSDVQGATVDELETVDRIYFYRVFLGLAPEEDALDYQE